MKTIKPGKVPAPAVYRGECRRCGCIVECDAAEASKTLYIAKCPTEGCGSTITLSREGGGDPFEDRDDMYPWVKPRKWKRDQPYAIWLVDYDSLPRC